MIVSSFWVWWSELFSMIFFYLVHLPKAVVLSRAKVGFHLPLGNSEPADC